MSKDGEYLEAVNYLWNWQHDGDSFSSLFFNLLGKADAGNRVRLRVAFPAWVEVYDDWKSAPEGTFFSKHLGKG